MKTHDGLHLSLATYGRRDAPLTVFLAHCWTLDKQGWHYQVRDLQRAFGHGIHVVTWDRRGHSKSDPVERDAATIANLARDWSDLIDERATTCPLVLARHSTGRVADGAVRHRAGPVRASGGSGVRLHILRRARHRDARPVRDRSAAAGPDPADARPSFAHAVPAGQASCPVVERLRMRRLVFGRPRRLADAAHAVDGPIRSPGHTVGFFEDFMGHDEADALGVLDDIPTHVLVGPREVLTPPSHARRISDQVQSDMLTIAPTPATSSHCNATSWSREC